MHADQSFAAQLELQYQPATASNVRTNGAGHESLAKNSSTDVQPPPRPSVENEHCSDCALDALAPIAYRPSAGAQTRSWTASQLGTLSV